MFFGHFFGEFIAQQYALLYGEHLAGLILSNTAPAVDYPELLTTNAQTYGMPEQAQLVLRALSDPTPFSDDEAFRHLWTNILLMYFRSNGHPQPFRLFHFVAYGILLLLVSIPNGRVGSNICSSKQAVLLLLTNKTSYRQSRSIQ